MTNLLDGMASIPEGVHSTESCWPINGVKEVNEKSDLIHQFNVSTMALEHLKHNRLTVSTFVEIDFRGIILLSTLSAEELSFVTHTMSWY